MKQISVFGLTKRDDDMGFYRIVQPLRFLQRNGDKCKILPFSGQNEFSILPVHDKLLMMLSENTDVIITTPILLEEDLLRMMDLRKYSGAKLVMDVSENLYDTNCDDTPFQAMRAVDGLIVSSENLKKIYKPLNENILVLPSGIDFKDIQKVNPCIDGDYELIKEVTDKIKIPEITLLPLKDNNYNRCLDNIRLLKYCASKIACVASNVESYKGSGAILCSSNYEWYDAIDKLQDKNYRDKVANECYDYAKKFDMKELIKPLKPFLINLKRKKI